MGFVAVLSCVGSAEARQWKPSPSTLAIDYLDIINRKATGGVVMIWWVAYPMLGSSQGSNSILDKYVVLALVDAKINSTGTPIFSAGEPQLQDATGKALSLVAGADVPSDLVGTIATLRSVMVQTLGPFGKGMQLFTYDTGSVHACSEGRLSVIYGGETYTYDTPIPGCPAN